MQTLIMLQQGAVLTPEAFYPIDKLAIYGGIAAVGGGIILGLILTLLGQIFGARLGVGTAILTMFLVGLVAVGACIGLLYAGQISVNEPMDAMNQYGDFATIAPLMLGVKAFLVAIGAGAVVLVVMLASMGRDAQGDRAALGSVLFVAILMLPLTAASFFGANYAFFEFVLRG